MFVLHFEGPEAIAPREWLDTGHPALATSVRPWGPARRWRQQLVQPLLIGGHRDTRVVLPGLEPLHATLEQSAPGVVTVRPTRPVRIDGVPVEGDAAELPVGAALSLGPWTVRLARTPELTPAQRQRLAALGTEPESWRVLADELEESGQGPLAEWLRAERTVTDEDRSRLRVLGLELLRSERATVASMPVLNCSEPQATCPGRWDRFAPDAEACLRTCPACRKSVLYCDDELEAAHFAGRGWLVVLDAGRPQPTRPWPPFPLLVVG